MKITPRPFLCFLFLLPLLLLRAQVVAVQVAEMKRTDFYGNILSCQDSTFTFVTDERDTLRFAIPAEPDYNHRRVGAWRAGDRYCLLARTSDYPLEVDAYLNLSQLLGRWLDDDAHKFLLFRPDGTMNGSRHFVGRHHFYFNRFSIAQLGWFLRAKVTALEPVIGGFKEVETGPLGLIIDELTDTTLRFHLSPSSDATIFGRREWSYTFRRQTRAERRDELRRDFGVE